MATTYSKNRFNTPAPPWQSLSTPMPPGMTANMAGPTQIPGQNYGGASPAPPTVSFPAIASNPVVDATGWSSPTGGGGSLPAAQVGGGGAGGANTNFGWPNIPDPAGGKADYVWGYIKGILSGKNVPFGAKEIDVQKAQAKSASENTFQQAKDELNSRAAATGYASSPAAGRQILEARLGASQQYGKAAASISIEAATQNYNAKLAALQGAQQWIDSLRSYVLQGTGMWWQREQAMAALGAAQSRFNQEMDLARKRFIWETTGGQPTS